VLARMALSIVDLGCCQGIVRDGRGSAGL
jgi:hypothetical protein